MHPLIRIALYLLILTTTLPEARVMHMPNSTIQLLADTILPSSDPGKRPHIAAAGNTIVVSGRSGARISTWVKPDAAAAFPNPIELGLTSGKADYASTAVTAGSDGSTYYAWIDLESKGIFMRQRQSNGALSEIMTVVSNISFASGVEIGIANDGRIFVVWNEDFLFRYRTSTDQGRSWSGTAVLSGELAQTAPAIASGPNGSVVVAHGADGGNIHAAIWNGAGFDDYFVAGGGRGDAFLADPGATIAPNGTIYLAWRRVGGGIFYAERQSNGSWPITHLADGGAFGTVTIQADADQNLHMFWISDLQTPNGSMIYAFKPAGRDWQGPVFAPDPGGYTYNGRGIVTLSNRFYGHAVTEFFTGDRVLIRYYLFDVGERAAAPAAPLPPDARPTIPYPTTRDDPVRVTFADVRGAPTRLYYRWDVPATSEDAELPFETNVAIPAPSGLNPVACERHTLFTLVANNDATQAQVHSIPVIFDMAVQVTAYAINPHLDRRPETYNSYLNGQGNVSNGDPRYTRDKAFFLGIHGDSDCSGIRSFSVSGEAPQEIADNLYQRVVSLPGDPAVGENAFTVTVYDRLGNVAEYPYTLIYDPASADGLPVLAEGGHLSISGEPGVVRSLSFGDIEVTDNLYGQQGENLPHGRQFWGIWIATARSNVGADSPSLKWYPIQVPSPDSAFSVQWNLLNGLDDRDRTMPGDIFVYVRFLDGAGNPSVRSLAAQVTLTAEDMQ